MLYGASILVQVEVMGMVAAAIMLLTVGIILLASLVGRLSEKGA